jgi:hypothetical protein
MGKMSPLDELFREDLSQIDFEGIHPGIKAIIQGDFGKLPDHPSDTDWQFLATMIDGYALSKKLGLGEFGDYLTRQCLPQYLKAGTLPEKSIELWIFLCGMQRREHWIGRPLEGKEKQAVFDIYKKLRENLSDPRGVTKLKRSLNVSEYSSYIKNLIRRYWIYQEDNFQPWQKFLDKPNKNFDRPPVFQKSTTNWNIITNPENTENERMALFGLISNGEHHRWYRSMNSSQALTLSVFGNLYLSGKLDILLDLRCDAGDPLLGIENITRDQFSLEKKIDYLGERRKTSIDIFISGDYQIAIECKFRERGLGTCTSPTLNKVHPSYCNGQFYNLATQKEKCPKSRARALYWDYVPLLFDWEKSEAINHCPLDQNYQLVRTILSAAGRKDKSKPRSNGHAVLIYDERNPQAQPGGKMFRSFMETKNALINPKMLRKISWQNILNTMRGDETLSWLTVQLHDKYGL